MVVEWTDAALAVADKTLDFTYYRFGQTQATKLKSEFRKVGKLIGKFPRMGSVERLVRREGEYRFVTVFNILKVIYRIDNPNHISIITIWDCRQNPENLDDVIQNEQ